MYSCRMLGQNFSAAYYVCKYQMNQDRDNQEFFGANA